MLLRTILPGLSALLCAVIPVAAPAQTTIPSINVPPASTSTLVAPPSPSLRPAASVPSPSDFAVAPPASKWLGQPLGNLSQPPLMTDQPAAFVSSSVMMHPASAIAPPPPSGIAEQPAVVIEAPSSSPVPSDLSESQSPPSYQPPAQSRPELAMMPPTLPLSLATRSGIDAGLQVSGYSYEQPNPSTDISGPRIGGTLTGTIALPYNFFASLDGRFSIGWLDYAGTGDVGGRRDTQWEARGLMGMDMIYHYFSLSPYSGFGFRDVNDDLEGSATSTGAHLPEMEDQIYYVPLGVHPRLPLTDTSRFSATAEYDFVVHGQEITHLNDAGTGNPTVRNEQSGGFGIHADIMYETPYWAIGPFASYWSMNTSNPSVYHSPGSTCGSTTCSFTQPFNHTIEGGVQFRVHFL
jgi:hypothetical protein